MVLGGGWVEWEREIRIKEVFIGWVGHVWCVCVSVSVSVCVILLCLQ